MFQNDINIDPFTNKPFKNDIVDLINKKINFLSKIGYDLEQKSTLTSEQKHCLFRDFSDIFIDF